MSDFSISKKAGKKSPSRDAKSSNGGNASQGFSNESLDSLSLLANQSKDSMALQDLSDLSEQSSSAKQLKAFSSQTPPAANPSKTSSSSTKPVQLEGDEQAQAGEDGGGGKKFAASLEQEMLLLQGELSLTSKVKGFFGMETSFSKIQKLINSYTSAKDDLAKRAYKQPIIRAGEEWLKKHDVDLHGKGQNKRFFESDQKNDEVKRKSIQRIVNALKNEKADEKPVGLASLSDKVTTGTKIMSNLKGASNFLFDTKHDEKSSFQKIEPVFEAYQKASEGEITSIGGLINMLTLAQNAKKGINDWMEKHKESNTPGDNEKRKTLESMLDNIGKFKASLTIQPYFTAEVRGVDIGETIGSQLTASSVSIIVKLPSGEAKGSLSNVSITEAGFNFSKLDLSYSGDLQITEGFKVSAPTISLEKTGDSYIFNGAGDLSLEMSPGIGLTSLNAEGHVGLGYDFANKKFINPIIENGSIDATLFDCVDINVKELGFAEGVFSASSGSMTVKAFEKEMGGTLEGISYSKEAGFGFKKAAITSSGTIDPIPGSGISVTNPGLSLEKTSLGWNITGSGRLGLTIDATYAQLTKAEADVSLTYGLKDKKIQQFNMSNGAIGLSLFDVIALTGDDINYENGALTIGSFSATLDGGDVLGAGLEGSGSDLVISKSAVDWSEIGVKINKVFEMGGFSFTPPKGIIRKEGASFIVLLEDAAGSLEVGEWFTAGGKGTLQWGPEFNNGKPKINSAELSVSAKTPKYFPKEFMPFGWPISTGFFMTVPAGPVPISGGVDVGIEGAAPLSFDANIGYDGEKFNVGGNFTLNPTLSLFVKIYAGAGTPLLVYIGGFIKGAVESQASASMGIEGTAAAKDNYEFSDITGKYAMNADFVAKLTAGLEVRALYFFNKELFDIVIKEWNLGNSSMSGEYDFLKKKSKLISGDKLLSGAKGTSTKADAMGIPLPEIQMRTKAFSAAIKKLFEAIQAEGIRVGKPAILGKLEGEGVASDSDLAAGKAEILKMADKAVKDSFDITEIDRLSRKENEYQKKIKSNSSIFNEWLASQNSKMEEAPAEGGSISISGGLHRKNKGHYKEKIEKGTEKHNRIKTETENKLKIITRKLTAFNTQSTLSTTIYAELDSILDPNSDVTIETITAKVDQYIQNIRKLKAATSPNDIPDPEDIGDLENI